MTAELECDKCGRTFTTPTTDDGGLKYDGVREHGEEYHQEERWDFGVISRE